MQYTRVPRPTSTALPFEPLLSSSLPRLRTPVPLGSCSAGLLFAPSAPSAAAGTASGSSVVVGVPGVILVGEWWGIDTHIINLARNLAAAAECVVFCLDFYRDGADALPVDEARKFANADVLAEAYVECAHKMRTANWMGAVQDVDAISSWLLDERHGRDSAVAQPEFHALKGIIVRSVHVVGASFGAVVSLLAAEHCRRIDSVVAFYGLPDAQHTGGAASVFTPENVAVPCQLHFPTSSPIPGFDDLAAARSLLPRLGRSKLLPHHSTAAPAGHHELIEYPEFSNNGHGFLNSANWWEDWKARLPVATGTPRREPFDATAYQRALRALASFVQRQHSASCEIGSTTAATADEPPPPFSAI